jgi:aryl-alcohol dehydrogenase-like predicted oxidoreductase
MIKIRKGVEIPRRLLGNTGEKVSIVGLGGGHIGHPKTDAESVKIIRTAIDYGINFMDNSWDYGEGKCEIRMGKALRDGYRKRVFLMTKIDSRSKKGAARQIDESLKRLRTDVIDLMQIHEIIHPDDPEKVFSEGGAIEALVDAKKAGKIRFIGFTGHKSAEMHLNMLKKADTMNYRFDTVQMPLNLFDAHFESFEKKVMPKLIEKSIGIIAMKVMAAGKLVESGAATPVECLRYVLSLPISVAINGCDSLMLVEQAVMVAQDFKPLIEAERTMLLAKTEAKGRVGQFEGYKTTKSFDGTTRNPQWLE